MRKAILIFGHNYATQFIDIYNQYVRLFDSAHYKVTVAYLTGKDDAEVKNRTLAEEVLFLNIPKRNIRYLKLRATFQLIKLCRERKFTVVICHRYKPAYLMLGASLSCKIPALICVMHELKTFASWGRKLLAMLLVKKNVLLAGVSNAVRDDIRKSLAFIPKEKIVTLYNIIDADLTEPYFLPRQQARRILRMEEDDFVFGNIARLAPNKNQHRLLFAFAAIQKNCPKAKLIIVGDGNLEHCLRQQAKSLGVLQRVFFTGFMPQGFRYMPAFDCFILPSTQEAFGRVLLEAMLAKIPVIAGRVHGIPEVLGKTGFLIDPNNVTEIANTMEKSYYQTQEQRAVLGENAYRRAKQNFSIPRFHEQFWQLPLFSNE